VERLWGNIPKNEFKGRSVSEGEGTPRANPHPKDAPKKKRENGC